jgi:hypothetical protein
VSSQVYPEVYELDLHDAYLSAAARPLPVGSVVRFLDHDVELDSDEFTTWYGRCIIFVTTPQTNFPLCQKGPTGHVRPIKEEGHYEVWGWMEEFRAAAKRPGVEIHVREGWGWLECQPWLKEWADLMHATRHKARAISPEVERCVKLAIVAGIGRHGCRPKRRSVIRVENAAEGDVVLSETLDGQYAEHLEPDGDAPWLTYWHDYIVMLIRLWQYDQIETEQAAGNTVICTNVDALFTLWPTKSTVDPDQLGGIRQRLRTNAVFPVARHIISDQSTKLPGIPLRDRVKT